MSLESAEVPDDQLSSSSSTHQPTISVIVPFIKDILGNTPAINKAWTDVSLKFLMFDASIIYSARLIELEHSANCDDQLYRTKPGSISFGWKSTFGTLDTVI